MAQITHILGIDPSMNATGIALLKPDGTVITSAVCNILSVQHTITAMFSGQQVGHVVISIEKIRNGSHFNKGGVQIKAFREARSAAAQIKKLIRSMFPRRNEIIEAYPETWRSRMYGRAKWTDVKGMALQYCKLVVGLEIKDHNQAEAVIIGLYGIHAARAGIKL